MCTYPRLPPYPSQAESSSAPRALHRALLAECSVREPRLPPQPPRRNADADTDADAGTGAGGSSARRDAPAEGTNGGGAPWSGRASPSRSADVVSPLLCPLENGLVRLVRATPAAASVPCSPRLQEKSPFLPSRSGVVRPPQK